MGREGERGREREGGREGETITMLRTLRHRFINFNVISGAFHASSLPINMNFDSEVLQTKTNFRST